MSTLVDYQIEGLCGCPAESALIDPYLPELLQPASYDVRLGHRFMFFARVPLVVDPARHSSFADLYRAVDVPDGGAYELAPLGFVLGHTIEYLRVPAGMASRVQGKSSLARLGLTVESAGYIDPGYQGVITLEIVNMLQMPVLLRPGMAIAQLAFERLDHHPRRAYGDPSLRSHYQGEASVAGSRCGTSVVGASGDGQSCYVERRESRPCVGCGEEIAGGQPYEPDGPFHLGCAVLHDRWRAVG